MAGAVVMLDGSEGMLAGALPQFLLLHVPSEKDHHPLFRPLQLAEVIVRAALFRVRDLLERIPGAPYMRTGT